MTDDALIGGRLHLLQPARGHRAGHDAVLLAASVPPGARRVVDLGAGVGTAGLAVALRLPLARVTLVEIDPAIAALAARNAGRQDPDMAERVQVVTADVATLARPSGPPVPLAGGADLVLMNPPFNDPARHRISPRAGRARAHSAEDDSMEAWLRAADRLLEASGELRLIHRPEAIGTLIELLHRRAGAVSIRPVHGRPDTPAIRVLVSAIKGRRTPPAILPGLVLADTQGRPTPEAERLLRGGGGLDEH
ncbi:methyltransferase [Ancylobacter pratisalsi]|uniref:Methyltransferase n=1 Tax=Ancylobacter pratisalsi TaxID=1745854 RepID=A0A6P1YSQ6_9HYPH|nr:methyltransferase [Ancylobacter pratisalsi]